jgi:indoleamine 2,3-dioxygenase
MNNWRRLDANGPIALGNIELMQNFASGDNGKGDEDWFILVHVDIEARAGAGMKALVRAGKGAQAGDSAEVEQGLAGLAASLGEMNRTMDRMPERCRPEVYFLKVRPYIFGFNGVVYEGRFGGAPQSYRGETGAQSSIVPSLLVGLGIKHKNSMLTAHLDDMRNYMPPAHREFVMSRVDVRPHVMEASKRGDATGRRLRDLYNACLAEVIAFRTRHFEYAVNYIEKRVDNPLATGGTPYISWLKQLIEETKAYHIE